MPAGLESPAVFSQSAYFTCALWLVILSRRTIHSSESLLIHGICRRTLSELSMSDATCASRIHTYTCSWLIVCTRKERSDCHSDADLGSRYRYLSSVGYCSINGCDRYVFKCATASFAIHFAPPPLCSVDAMTGASEIVDSKPTYRYLPSPEEQLIPRNVPTTWMPALGDFVVFSVDPVASVAHLDKVARQAAKKIRTHRHVGLIIMVRSCRSLMTAFHSKRCCRWRGSQWTTFQSTRSRSRFSGRAYPR